MYENIPQLFFQSYVMFRVGITEGAFEVAVLGSILISLTSVSSVLVMVADRGKIRKQSLGAIEDNPKCVQVVANAIACFFGISFNEKHIKNIINYTVYTVAAHSRVIFVELLNVALVLGTLFSLLHTLRSRRSSDLATGRHRK